MFLRAENNDDSAKARIAHVDQRIEHLRDSLGSDDGKARLELASILSWRGEYRTTLDLLAALDQSSPFAMEARQLIGDAHYRHDQYDLAAAQYRESLELASGDEYWRARAQEGIAWVLIDVGHYASGEFAEAQKIFEEHLPRHRQYRRWGHEAMSLYGLSRTAAGLGDYGAAIELAQRSIGLLEANGGQNLLQLPILQLANVYRDRGSFDRAKPYYSAAIDAADHSQDPYSQVLIAFGYGCLLQFAGDLDGACAMWKSVLPTIEELEFPRLGHETCNKLATAAAARSDYEEAYRFQKESLEYGNGIGVISTVLNNQQMLLRSQMHRSAQLEDTLNHLKEGVEASVDGIFVLGQPESEDFIIHFVNATAAQMLGKTPIDVTHVLLTTAWKSPSSKLLLDPSLTVFETGRRCTLDPIQLEFIEGNPRSYSVKIAKISEGVAWTVSDVTERQAMQREILAQRDRLAEANTRLTALDREKTEMLAIAAHDLRSPIGNIRSLCDLITTDDPESLEVIETIVTISESLLTLIQNLLDVERIERGEMELNMSRVDVSPLLSQIVGQFSSEAANKRIEIVSSLPVGGVTVHVDESALRRIVQNLLSNAIKFSPSGSTVSVRAIPIGPAVRIEIQDQGQGISESDRQKLFAKFARLSAQPTAGESSTGLGLSIVKRLVEAMRGEVGCTSYPSQGATFWVEFTDQR